MRIYLDGNEVYSGTSSTLNIDQTIKRGLDTYRVHGNRDNYVVDVNNYTYGCKMP